LAAVSMEDPQTWNRYAYVENMPPTNADPSGLGPRFHGGDVQTNCQQFCYDGFLPGMDEFDLAAMGLLPLQGGPGGFCPAQFTGCSRTICGTRGIRFDGSVSSFILGR